MFEVPGDIWDFHSSGYRICITTNGTLKGNGACVMGRGVASQAKSKFPKLALELGNKIAQDGNRVHWFPRYNLFSFPVKHAWWEKADMELISTSCAQLTLAVTANRLDNSNVYLVRPGCGNGQLDWSTVKPVLYGLLGNRFVVVQN